MYLKSLTLKGFKSFADKTQMVFDPGLTVVVGPNGSGKSNISDSILWVLGEQSAKMLRGQAMEDVIFSGSSGRSAVGLAEVTLTLDNTDHTLPIDFSEIALTRRMYRSGESEYLINGSPARLRDITDILHDSGLGKDTHSIISQGKLDSILASRAEERRELIEEAAGISKHRKRKERALRKMGAMQDNLLRAKDIEKEVMRQLKPLEKQVDKACRHKELTAQLKDIKTILLVDDLRELQRSYQKLSESQVEAEAHIELCQYRLGEKDRELEKLQSLLEQKGLFVGDLGERRRRMQDILGRMDSDMRLLEEKGKNMVARLSELRMSLSGMERQKSEAEAEHERVVAEFDAAIAEQKELDRLYFESEPAYKQAKEERIRLSQEIAELTNKQKIAEREADREYLAHAKLKDQISNAEVEDDMFKSRLAQIEDRLHETEEALAERKRRHLELTDELASRKDDEQSALSAIQDAQADIAERRKALSALQEALSLHSATLSALKNVDAKSSGQSQLESYLADVKKDSITGRLSDVLDVPKELESVVEGLLGDDLSALVVPDMDTATSVAELVRESSKKGRATLCTLSDVASERTTSDIGVPLLEQISARGEAAALITRIFANVYVVDSMQEALLAWQKNPRVTFVAKDGGYILSDGRVRLGALAGAEEGSLERKRRIRELESEVPQKEEAVSTAKGALEAAERELQTKREVSARIKSETAELLGESKSISSEIGRLEAQISQAASERAHVEKSRAEAAARSEKARLEVEEHKALAEEAQERAAELLEQLEEKSAKRQEASREESKRERELSELKLKRATVSERRNHLAIREEKLAKDVAALTDRLQTSEEAAYALDIVRHRVEPLHMRYKAIYDRAEEWARRLRDRASLAEADSDSLKKTIGDAREAKEVAQKELDAAKTAANEINVSVGKLEVQVETAIKAIVDLGAVLDEALLLPEPEDRPELERKLRRIETDLSHIGPVNEVAMDEYTRLKERADYIHEQVADLEAARAALVKITSAIERKMRKQFLLIFDAVNENFKEIFGLLFPGGSAELEMTDPDHLDQTGIEIIAQPRGKKIQKMSLMSGGEKSLTALALLFAVYKTRTVPFYVFDEVEAALDDANLSKLLDAIERLKDTTQLIVISHQRRTMEQADVLYGVSMQADGVSHVVSQRLAQKA